MPLVCAWNNDSEKFVMTEQFSEQVFEKFVFHFDNKDIKPYIKSEELPIDNENNDVKIAVAKNIVELVMNANKDTLIQIYSPDCRYCRILEPIYEQLGECQKFVISYEFTVILSNFQVLYLIELLAVLLSLHFQSKL